MYHRFNESKYPSTNVQMEIFKDQIQIIRNSNYDFYQKRSEDGKISFCFYFNVMNYKDALIIEEYIDNIN